MAAVTVAGEIRRKQQAVAPAAAAVADMYILTVAARVTQVRVMKAAQEYGKDLVKLAAVVGVDLLEPDNKVTEMPAVQADPALLY